MGLVAMTAGNKDPVEAQALTPADIMRIAETEGPQAADAALQRLRRAREAREAEAPSDIDYFVLGDLEVGAGETGEMIEAIGELDVAGEDAVESAIAETEGYEAQDMFDEARKEPMTLREQMRAARAKLNGGVEGAEDDPLAKDRKKIAKTFQKVGRTLADLPADWDKLPRITKIPGERSRQSEFYRVFCEGEEEMREAERQRELEKRGRPANYHLLPFDEKLRIDANARQRRHRDKKRKPPSKPTVAPLPVADIARDMLRDTLVNMLRRLEKWAVNYSTPLARQLRKPEQQRALIRAAAAYARIAASTTSRRHMQSWQNGFAAPKTKRDASLMY
jgi:hypothetical protein